RARAARGKLDHVATSRSLRAHADTRSSFEALRNGLAQHPGKCTGHPGAQRFVFLHAKREARVLRNRRVDLCALCRIELAVGVGHEGFVVVLHAISPLASSASSAASAVRPRASRLVSVPIGISNTPAASLYDMPSTSTSATARRCSSGSLFIASDTAHRPASVSTGE